MTYILIFAPGAVSAVLSFLAMQLYHDHVKRSLLGNCAHHCQYRQKSILKPCAKRNVRLIPFDPLLVTSYAVKRCSGRCLSQCLGHLSKQREKFGYELDALDREIRTMPTFWVGQGIQIPKFGLELSIKLPLTLCQKP